MMCKCLSVSVSVYLCPAVLSMLFPNGSGTGDDHERDWVNDASSGSSDHEWMRITHSEKLSSYRQSRFFFFT